jgi:hypothetical protein
MCKTNNCWGIFEKKQRHMSASDLFVPILYMSHKFFITQTQLASCYIKMHTMNKKLYYQCNYLFKKHTSVTPTFGTSSCGLFSASNLAIEDFQLLGKRTGGDGRPAQSIQGQDPRDVIGAGQADVCFSRLGNWTNSLR